MNRHEQSLLQVGVTRYAPDSPDELHHVDGVFQRSMAAWIWRKPPVLSERVPGTGITPERRRG